MTLLLEWRAVLRRMGTALVLLIGTSGMGWAQQGDGADALVGEWVTAEGKAGVLISRCDSTYCGKIIWLKDPIKNGKEVVDDKNPDPSLHSRTVLGMTILWGFSYDGENVWKGGKVYDPENGSTYSGKIALTDSGELKLRGYVLLPLLGRTEIWTR